MKRLTAWLAALAAVACATGAAGQEIKIRFAHLLSATEPEHLAAEFFAKNVGARTNGRVQVQDFPGEQLGPGKEVNEMIRQGANVMNITDPGYLSDFVPDIGVLNGPYLIQDPKDYERLLASDWYKATEKKLEAAGFKLIMANGFFGQRHLIADKAVRKPEDMAGMTVRGSRHSRPWGPARPPFSGPKCTALCSRTSSRPLRRRSGHCGGRSCTRPARRSR